MILEANTWDTPSSIPEKGRARDAVLFHDGIAGRLVFSDGRMIAKIEVYSITGKHVLSAAGICTLDTTRLLPGMYIAVADNSEKMKFIK